MRAGKHYVHDVLAGALIGGASGFLLTSRHDDRVVSQFELAASQGVPAVLAALCLAQSMEAVWSLTMVSESLRQAVKIAAIDLPALGSPVTAYDPAAVEIMKGS